MGFDTDDRPTQRSVGEPPVEAVTDPFSRVDFQAARVLPATDATPMQTELRFTDDQPGREALSVKLSPFESREALSYKVDGSGDPRVQSAMTALYGDRFRAAQPASEAWWARQSDINQPQFRLDGSAAPSASKVHGQRAASLARMIDSASVRHNA
jgi:hypothetical protein